MARTSSSGPEGSPDLSITGGALAIVAGAMTGAPEAVAMGMRACTSCGMLFQMDFAHCPHCGHAVGGMKV